MYINNRMASLIYKLALIVVCLVGLLLNSGLFTGTFAPYVLLYYSLLSNIFCLIFFAVSAIVTGVNIKRSGKFGVIRFAPHFKGAIVMGMLLTMFVYPLVAHGNISTRLTSMVIHFVVPLMTLVDWCLFDKKGRFSVSDPLIWSIIPFSYYGILLLAAQFGVTYYGGVLYPYPFINPYRYTQDPTQAAWAPVLVNVFLLALVYVAVGYLLFGADRLLDSQAKKRALAKAQQRAASLIGPANEDAVLAVEGENMQATGADAASAPTVISSTAAAGNASVPQPLAPAPGTPAAPAQRSVQPPIPSATSVPPASVPPVAAPRPQQPPPAAAPRPMSPPASTGTPGGTAPPTGPPNGGPQ